MPIFHLLAGSKLLTCFLSQILDVYTTTQLFYTKFNLQKFENVHFLLSALSNDS